MYNDFSQYVTEKHKMAHKILYTLCNNHPEQNQIAPTLHAIIFVVVVFKRVLSQVLPCELEWIYCCSHCQRNSVANEVIGIKSLKFSLYLSACVSV